MFFGHIHAGYGVEGVRFDGVQAAYEEVMRRNGGVWRLVKVFFEYVRASLYPRKASSGRTIMVNAAMVGGLKRDILTKGPVIVHI
jgi:hypothetical protein